MTAIHPVPSALSSRFDTTRRSAAEAGALAMRMRPSPGAGNGALPHGIVTAAPVLACAPGPVPLLVELARLP